VGEHLVFQGGFRDMRGKTPPAPARSPSAEAHQLGHGRVRRMRREAATAPRVPERNQPLRRLLDNLAWLAEAFDADHLEERKDAERSSSPDFRQEVRHGLNVGHGGSAGAKEHACAMEPGLEIVGAAPGGLGHGDDLEPVGEDPGRRELACHVRVIQMAVGIDQAGHEDHVAQVHRLLWALRREVAPASDGDNAATGNQEGAVDYRRPGNRQDNPGAQ